YITAVQLKYGDCYEVHFGAKRIIILLSSDTAYPIHTSSVALNCKFLYRDSPNPDLNEVGYEQSGIIANRNLDEWKINREFFKKTVMSKRFLRKFTGKIYEWLTRLAGDLTVSTATGISTYSKLSYFNSFGYDYNYDHIPASKWELSSKERRAEIDSLPSLPSDFLALLLTANTPCGQKCIISVIKPVRRVSPSFPALPQPNSEPVEIGEYLMKKGSTILINYKGININENDWID
ncbi:7660_t:CDS:2, partial [Racocetra persica]